MAREKRCKALPSREGERRDNSRAFLFVIPEILNRESKYSCPLMGITEGSGFTFIPEG